MTRVVCGVLPLNVMEKGAVTKVLNDFFTVSEGEISLKKGDIVQVSSESFFIPFPNQKCKDYVVQNYNFT
jgi:hypothetical protein